MLGPEADQVVLSVNPKSGRRSSRGRVERLVKQLTDRGFTVEVFTDLALVSAAANKLHAEGRLRALVGVGGDGTAGELTNRTDPGVPFTLLRAGTANILAKHFRLSHKPDRLCDVIADGCLRQVDAASANGRLFLVMASCGLDAEVVQQVHAHRAEQGGHIGYRSYIKPILRSLRSYRYPEIRIKLDDECDAAEAPETTPVVGRWVFALNLPRYGWGLPLAPEADAADGLLDLCAFRRGSLWHGLRYVAAAQLGGWHRRLSDCEMRRARRLRIECDEPLPYQLDGDPAGHLPIDIEVLPGRLTLVVPRSCRSGRA